MVTSSPHAGFVQIVLKILFNKEIFFYCKCLLKVSFLYHEHRNVENIPKIIKNPQSLFLTCHLYLYMTASKLVHLNIILLSCPPLYKHYPQVSSRLAEMLKHLSWFLATLFGLRYYYKLKMLDDSLFNIQFIKKKLCNCNIETLL